MELLLHFMTTSIALCIYSRHDVNAATMQEVKDIHEEVLNGYNKNVLPIRNQSADFEVEALITLQALSDLEETEERLTTVMILQLFWKDESIVWNASVNEIFTLTLEASTVWRPHIAVTNAHASSKIRSNEDWHLIGYHYTGDAIWVTMRTFETTCEIDTTYYPFDVQRCSVEIFLYGYYGRIKFRPIFFDESHLYYYQPQGTWNVTDFYISNQNASNVTMTYHLERNPRYMVINFLVPLLVLAFLNPIVFVIPADSGERLGYSITIMLALSVYMTLLGEYLPKNSDPIPIMTYNIMMLYILSAVSMCFLFISARVYNTPKSKPVPRVLKTFVIIVRRIFCEDVNCGRNDRAAKMEEESISCLEDAENKDDKNVKNGKDDVYFDTGKKRTPASYNKAITWHSVSKSMDVVFMILIYVVKVLLLVIVMHVLSQRKQLERIISKEPAM